jgi:hypothetical protein
MLVSFLLVDDDEIRVANLSLNLLRIACINLKQILVSKTFDDKGIHWSASKSKCFLKNRGSPGINPDYPFMLLIQQLRLPS